jgi:hypothetical protein
MIRYNFASIYGLIIDGLYALSTFKRLASSLACKMLASFDFP